VDQVSSKGKIHHGAQGEGRNRSRQAKDRPSPIDFEKINEG
jgi:hypothetical protein